MTPSLATPADKRRAFRKLHESGCFVIPNPWDVGSARYLQILGFKALASTSSGAAWSMGLPDNGLSRSQVLEHLHDMVAATDLPLNADFEDGFAADPAGVGESVRLAVETGIAGLSIEDSIRGGSLYPVEIAVERLRAARRAIDAGGGDVMLIGRAECFLVGQPDIELTVFRTGWITRTALASSRGHKWSACSYSFPPRSSALPPIRASKQNGPAQGWAVSNLIPATTDSPTQSPAQYHGPWRA